MDIAFGGLNVILQVTRTLSRLASRLVIVAGKTNASWTNPLNFKMNLESTKVSVDGRFLRITFRLALQVCGTRIDTPLLGSKTTLLLVVNVAIPFSFVTKLS